MSVKDLTEEERGEQFRLYWPILLDLLAEKHVAISMHRQGLFHRDTGKNEKMAAEAIKAVELVRSGILAAVTGA